VDDPKLPPEAPALAIIHRPSGDPGRTQQLGPYRLETLIDPSEEGAGIVHRVFVAPHERTSVSYHRIAEEFYFVLAGSGTAILDGREYRLAAGDFLRLPPGTTHGFVTADAPLEMLDIQVPGCRPDRDVFFVGGPPPDGFATSP
jgi:mannose-6-phosphate isomerase-like protein (cupin superfamily)